MFGIPLPYLLLGLSVALFGTYRSGYHFGWSDRDKEMQIAIAKKNEEAREIERNMTTKLNATATQLMETTNVVNQKQSALDNAIRAGRMRLPTSSCVQATPSPSVATTDSKAGSQPSGQTNETSDSERATLLAIAEIVAQGDKNTAALNACVDAYELVRKQLNVVQ
jgi:seryl-tRNA synthetase